MTIRITQTAVPVTTTSTPICTDNPGRVYLAWMVVGTADVTVSSGSAPAVVGSGFVYQASGASKQGASQEFPTGVPTNAFQAIAAATGSTILVWEGV